MRTKTRFNSLEDLYRSPEFDAYRGDKLGNDLFISDPDRAERIQKYANDGADGSTHAEVLEDCRDFLSTLKVIDLEFSEDGGDISEEDFTNIEAEIDACEQWHEKNGSLDKIIG